MIQKPALLLGALGALCVVCTVLSALASGNAAEPSQAVPPPPDKPADAGTAEKGAASAGGVYSGIVRDYFEEDPSQCAVRVGYWGTSTSGSPVKVGEYQDLGASPFFDIDGIRSDGRRTLNYTITGTDAESNDLNLNFYRPGVEVNVNYQRFPHLLGHENLGEFLYGTQLDNNDAGASGITTRQQQFLRQDNNIGEDYAIRVQELRSNFKWTINDKLRARLDVWGLYKEGERQVNAMQECYGHTYSPTDPASGAPPVQTTGNGAANHCHVLSQAQHINWQTTEVKPVIELNLGRVVLEYSRPMRVFSQGDQTVYRYYDSRSSATGVPTAVSEFGNPRYMEYGVVPDSDTQIDQLKISADLNDCNKVYAFLFAGNTHKSSPIAAAIASPSSGTLTSTSGTTTTRDVLAPFDSPESDERIANRQFSGADVRWTNTALKNVTITTFGRTVGENNEPAAFLIPGEETRPNTYVNGVLVPGGTIEDAPTEITPINYQRTQLGTKATWRPFGRGFGLGGLAITGGYEYSDIHRVGLEVDTGSDDPPFEGTIIEENTISNAFSIRPSVRWSPELETFVSYKYTNTQDPLFATNSHQTANAAGTSYDYQAVALNSALPTNDNLIEFGGTLMPSDRFLLCGWVGIDIQSQNIGQVLVTPGTSAVTPFTPNPTPQGFSSQSFPFGVNGSYRCTDKWTLNGGAAYYSNFITQDVAFGAGADHTFIPYGLLQNQWGYSSRAAVYTLGSTYDLTCKVRLIGLIEYVKGLQYAYQIAGDPRFPDATAATAGVPQYLRQDVASTRLSAGVDWRLTQRWSTYFRYVLYNYEDSANEAQIAQSTQPVTGLPLSGTSNLFLGGLTGMF
jgi:hypothetical protein